MTTYVLNLQTLDGPADIDATGAYLETKAAFLSDYADDPAVMDTVFRNGDLAERDYSESIKHLSPERCALATVAQINGCLRSAARLALCSLATGYRTRKVPAPQ